MNATTLEAARLILSGYARTSNSARMVSRIDMEDWKAPDEDSYRRVKSKDTLVVSKGVFALMPSSSHYTIGYREVVPPMQSWSSV